MSTIALHPREYRRRGQHGAWHALTNGVWLPLVDRERTNLLDEIERQDRRIRELESDLCDAVDDRSRRAHPSAGRPW